jgi:flagellar protein FlaF
VSVIERARTAYDPANQAVRSPRSTEYEAFARVTRSLSQAARASGGATADLARAVHENRRLWTVLAADVADPSNGLAADTRARLFYLAEFTVQQSRKVLRNEASADILVEINTAVMGGLRTSAGPA